MTESSNTSAPTEPSEGSTLYYALLKVPASTRLKLLAVLNLSQTLAKVLNDVTEPAVAETKIHWWHEELARLQDGSAESVAGSMPDSPSHSLPHSLSRHPATRCLVSQLRTEDAYETALNVLDPTPWLAILSANSDEKFINASDEARYQARLQQDFYQRVQLCSQLLLKQGKIAGDDWLKNWASSLGQFDRLRRFHQLHSLGYPVFPDEDYNRFDLEPAEINHKDKIQRVSALFTHRIDAAITAFQSALNKPIKPSEAGLLPFYIMGSIRLAQLQHWQKHSILPSQAYCTLTPFRKAWLAWRYRSQIRSQLRGKKQ